MREFNQLSLRTLLTALLFPATLFGQAPASLKSKSMVQQAVTSGVSIMDDGDHERNNAEAALSTLTLPAGTRVLMKLVSPLHTTSAVAGSGVYLETAAPVVQANRVVIPLRTQVLGDVEDARRPGRVKGRAQLRLHFTSLVFANNYVTPIDGALQSLPGNGAVRTQDTKGTIEPVDQIDRDVGMLATTTAAGFLIGSIRGGRIRASEYSARGAGIGAGIGLGEILFTRGDDIRLESGSLVEMVLRQPITVELQQVPTSLESVSQSRFALPEPRQNSVPLEQNGRSYRAPRGRGLRLPILPWPMRELGW